MKAIVHSRYGSPEFLEFRDVDAPTPRAGEVLVRVHAASVNPADWHIMRADPFLVRVMGMGFFKPKKSGLGADVAGVVEAVGPDVTHLRVGDEVFGGSIETGSGSLAEYVVVSADALVKKPQSLDFDEAAAIPLAALTALLALRDVGRVQGGDRVLIQGASGGVGTFAVQLAKHYGAEVTAVTSTRNVSLVRSLGADHVVDYTEHDWTRGDERYDLILGVAGYQPLDCYVRHLTEAGTYVAVGGTNGQIFEGLLLGSLYSLFTKKKLQSLVAQPTRADLEFIRGLAASGELRAVIDRRYPLSRAADAIRYLEEGHARGKVVVEVVPTQAARRASSAPASSVTSRIAQVRFG